MAKCDVCGNDYDKAFTVTMAGRTQTFDAFECAIHALAPVCGDHDGLVGMLTDRDITVRATAGASAPTGTCVGDVMTPNLIYVFEDQDVTEAARLMEENQIRRLVVLDRDKRLVGIVSL